MCIDVRRMAIGLVAHKVADYFHHQSNFIGKT